MRQRQGSDAYLDDEYDYHYHQHHPRAAEEPPSRTTSLSIARQPSIPRQHLQQQAKPLDTDSPYADEEPYYGSSNAPAITRTGYSPSRIEDGNSGYENNTDKYNNNNMSPPSNDYQPDKSGAQFHQRQQGLRPISPPMTLPSGASTPNLESANHHDKSNVSTYPPPQPTWGNLPNKVQLAILACSRFVDFFQMAAIQTYMVHQLKSFDPELPDSVISHQAGILQGSFTAAQIVTSILWGRAADQPSVGRKLVLLIGLIGTGFGCIGVGFSSTFGQAVFWRVLSGAINGTVGSARTMVAEITPKPWHPRAFLLLPAAFNVANVLGPILGGVLADPTKNFPHLFGAGGTFGGANGVGWMEDYPYAVANLLSTVLLFAEAILVYFGLEETLKGKRPLRVSQFDPIALFRSLTGQITNARDKGFKAFQETQRHGLLSNQERNSFEMDRLNSESGEREQARPSHRLPFRRIWTSNVLWTLVTIAIFDFHMGAFSNLWILFLATPRQFIPDNAPPDYQPPHGFFKFSQGLNFPPPTIGFAMAIIGFIGVLLQFVLYPWANARFGLMRCFRYSLVLFPLAYYLAPYIALLPSSTPSPEPSSGFAVWAGISFVLLLQVSARTFALPASIILLNNSSPHPSVLGTIHGVGQACSATFRTIGPMLAGYWYGTWLDRGVVGMGWWIVALVACVGCVAAFWVRNGSGHEIFLPGEEGEEKEEVAGPGGSGDGR